MPKLFQLAIAIFVIGAAASLYDALGPGGVTLLILAVVAGIWYLASRKNAKIVKNFENASKLYGPFALDVPSDPCLLFNAESKKLYVGHLGNSEELITVEFGQIQNIEAKWKEVSKGGSISTNDGSLWVHTSIMNSPIIVANLFANEQITREWQQKISILLSNSRGS